jgi:RNA polymerase sigma-70 factor (ECF subfamily)
MVEVPPAPPSDLPLQADDISRLYRDHARTLLVFVARRVYDPEVAMDVVAETFAAAFSVRHQFRDPEGSGDDGDAVAWLYGIARHQLSRYYRRGRVERRALERLGVERRGLTDPEYERIEELAGLADLREAAAAALARLSAEHRSVVQLRVIEERSYPYVAEQLGISEQAARARLSRALREMAASPLCISGGDPLSEALGT